MEEESLDPDGIGVVTGSQTVAYRGKVVWKGGKVEMVLIPGGYATLADGKESGAPTFHYYTTDYLGNVRAVTNGSTGLTEQLVAYYPFGGTIPTLGGNLSAQPYKFGGKELLTANGLNEYDFGARNYAPMVPAFTSVDPLCEKYYWLSPYLYCANNPVNIIDKNGKELTFTGGTDDDYLYICSLMNNITQNQYSFNYNPSNDSKSVKISSSLNKSFASSELSDGNKTVNSLISSIIDDKNNMSINISNSSDVLIGDVVAKSVDLNDVRNIGSHEAISSESVFLHEIIEQSELQLKGNEYNTSNINKAHNMATQMETIYMGISISPVRIISDMDSSGKRSMTVNYSMGKVFDKETKSITIQFLKNNVIP